MAVKKKSVVKKERGTKKKSTALVSYRERLQKQVEEQSARAESSTRSSLSIKGGSFTYQDTDLGDVLDCVILNFGYENSYFDLPYDPENPAPPACFAVPLGGKEMIPTRIPQKFNLKLVRNAIRTLTEVLQLAKGKHVVIIKDWF